MLDHLDVLRGAVAHVCRDRPFEILAWVVLPDHMHAVWRLPEGDANFSSRMGAIKGRFSRMCRAQLVAPTAAGNGASRCALRPGEAGICQRRFWEHHIRDDADYAAHVRYCWMNPVKHGLVARPEDWPYSSVHRDIRAGRYEFATA